jgi:Ca-activated chloride channel family protein
MNLRVTDLPDTPTTASDDGIGALCTERGNLPLRALDLHTQVTGLTARTVVTQTFHNPHAEPIEATYIFPLPDRAAVSDMTMTVAGRTVVAELRERGQARREYASAIRQGKRAAIAEAERPDVFTMRVGNIAAGEEAVVSLTLVGPLAYEDDEATLRLPLVVAPRYIPGEALGMKPVGEGHAPDTDAVPDASRITPPVLLPGFPNPIDLSIVVDIDPAGLALDAVRSSLHAVATDDGPGGAHRVRIRAGERVNRDFILRFAYGDTDSVAPSLVTTPDAADATSGVFQLTALPPRSTGGRRDRDVVVLLDRSGSMRGWKMVAARRAASRIVDSLSGADRFAVRCFDTEITAPDGMGEGLAAATDRHRYRAVEHLARTDSRGGTDILTPLTAAVDLLARPEGTRDRVIVLVTDGQVGNEDQILAALAPRLGGIRVHVVGIDQAINAGFLHRLALTGRGRCELVESEDRLDEATAHIHRRIVAPVVTDLALTANGASVEPETLAPQRMPDLFSGAPLVVSGRYSGATGRPSFTLAGTDADGSPWSVEPAPIATDNTAVRSSWARAHLRDLEDRYAAASGGELAELEKSIVDTSLRYRVLSRFTAFIAVDARVVNEGGEPRRITQPVEMPQGWEPPAPGGPAGQPAGAPMSLMSAPAFGGAPTARVAMTPGKSAPPRAMYGRPPAVFGRHDGPPSMGDDELRDMLRAELQLLDPDVHTMQIKAPAVVARERRAALSDLATRLSVVIEALAAGPAFGDAAVARLRDLLPAFRSCDGPTPPTGAALDTLWRDTIALLRELLESGGATPTNQTGEDDSGEEFWKRRG